MLDGNKISSTGSCLADLGLMELVSNVKDLRQSRKHAVE